MIQELRDTISIRENSKIKGIEIDGCILKITQLADDTTCFVADILSLSELLFMFKCFRLCAGLKINADKTKANYIVSLKGRGEAPLSLDWTDPYINCLGITLSGNENDHYELNYKKGILNLRNALRYYSDVCSGATCHKVNEISSGRNDYLSPFF